MFNLSNFEMSNCFSINKMQNTQIYFDQVMIEVMDCLKSEMTILYAETLEIRNFLVTQNQRYFQKVLHSTIDCVQQLAIFELYFFLMQVNTKIFQQIIQMLQVFQALILH
ncbi:unnamed protein product [Paramecium sonneborni]|uniref:Uncharacterized protein n=1 Tax=Paramecium sonneborni TaxID=65129 RepID=A0A8S1QQ01_9CILI|nr:unnamed protein product [Paramecium sonneborni]